MPKARSRASVISSRRAPGDFHKRFWTVIGERPQACAKPGGKHHCFHWEAFIEGLSSEGLSSPTSCIEDEEHSFAHLLELQMPHRHFHAIPGTKMFCQLFRKINRTVLSTGAAEGNHEVFESSLAVTGYAGID